MLYMVSHKSSLQGFKKKKFHIKLHQLSMGVLISNLDESAILFLVEIYTDYLLLEKK